MNKYYEEHTLNDTRETFGRTICEADIIFHAGHTGDFFPHHLDKEFCKKQPFKKRIAHGTMTFSIGIGLSATSINEHAMTYGYDKLRFPKPVFIGDTIRTHIEITKKTDYAKNDKFGLVVETCKVLNQHDEVVLYCEHILLVEKKHDEL